MTGAEKAAQSLTPGAIAVWCDEKGRVDCKRCGHVLDLGQVAFLTRTSPSDNFEAWCVECSLQLSRWALCGAAMDKGDVFEAVRNSLNDF